MHNSKIKSISLAVCLALMPFTAHAVGMGKMTVMSGLGEPLNAEIELLAPTKDELSNLSARIAPIQTYTDQGIDRPAVLGHVKVELVSDPSGSAKLKLTTQRPVNDPFLDMLIQVEWSAGQLLREYTALLDPPNYGDQSMAEAGVSEPVVIAEAKTAAKPPMPQTKGKKGKIKKSSAAPEAASEKAASEYSTSQPGEMGGAEASATEGGETYKVHSGDTLHGIAQKMQVEGVSLDQMLVGLYRGNKDAFAGENMNRLKVGKILKVPDVETLQAVSQQEAAREIRVQSADWNAYRNNLAGRVAESAPVPEEAATGRAASGKITGPAEDKAAPPATGPRDVVKLSKSDAGAATGKEAASPQDVAAAKKDNAVARDKAAKEENERVAALEKQIQELQKLLEMKSQPATGAKPGAVPQPTEPAAPKPKAEPKPAAAAQPPAPAAAPAPAQPPAPTAAPAPVQPPAPAAAPAPAQPPAPAAAKPAAPAPQPEAGVLDSLLNDPLFPAGLGGLLAALLGGAWFYNRSKRRKGLDAFEESILSTGGLKANTVFGNTAGGVVDTSEISFVTDFSHGAGAGMIDTSDVDPIAEAEVYMAYGRDAQAEEILKDAIAKEPTRYELHQKLLEIYANRNDSGAFEAMAGELYTTLGANDPHWVKVAEMGHKLEPDNPLYSSGGAQEEAKAPEAADLQFTDSDNTSTSSQPELSGLGADKADEKPAEEGFLDFDMASDQSTVQASEQQGAEIEQQPMAAETAPGSADALNEIAPLDFSLDLTTPSAPESAKPEPLAESLDFSLPDALKVGDSDNADANNIDAALELPAMEDFLQGKETPVPAAALETSEKELPAAMPEIQGMDFDLGAIEPTSQSSDDVAESMEINFDLPQVEEAAAKSPATDDSVVGVTSDELPAVTMEDLEQAMHLESPAEEAAAGEQIVLGPVTEEPAVEDKDAGLSFDLDQTIDADAEKQSEQQPAPASLDIDLSGISLDFEEAAPEIDRTAPAGLSVSQDAEPLPQLELPPQQDEGVVQPADLTAFGLDEKDLAGSNFQPSIAAIESESSDVETKLDLVTAYLDMGDAEGARELIEEVLREGGPEQRKRAQALADSIS